MSIKKISVALGCVVVAICSSLAVAQQTATDSPAPPKFSASEQAAREEILQSDRWQKARYELNQWLSVQTTYDKKQTAQLKAQLQLQVDGLSAGQLKAYLIDMEGKLKVLMSPEMTQARSWVKQFYTPQAQAKIAKRVGIERPLNMTASQLTEALQRFEDERKSRNSAQAEFNQTRQQEVTMQRADQQANAQASERALDRASRSARSSYPYASPYAPQNMNQKYSTPSSGGRYSIGPWGGVWRSGL